MGVEEGKVFFVLDKYLERVLGLVLLLALLLHVIAVHVWARGVVDQGELEQRAEHERQTHARPHVNSLQIATKRASERISTWIGRNHRKLVWLLAAVVTWKPPTPLAQKWRRFSPRMQHFNWGGHQPKKKTLFTGISGNSTQMTIIQLGWRDILKLKQGK